MSAEHHLAGAVPRARKLRRRMTLPEKLLWVELRKLKLNVRRQAPVGRYIADFACHSAGLIVEIDSARHELPDDQVYDLDRTAWLSSQGYGVLRFRNDQVLADAVGIAEQIRIAIRPPEALPLEGGGWGGGVPTAGDDRTPEALAAIPPPQAISTPPVHRTAG